MNTNGAYDMTSLYQHFFPTLGKNFPKTLQRSTCKSEMAFTLKELVDPWDSQLFDEHVSHNCDINFILYRRRACTQVLFLWKAKLRFFHFLEIVTWWLIPSTSLKIPIQPSQYLPIQKILLVEKRFLQVGKGLKI